MPLEKMDEFFNARADIYDSHMLDDLRLDEFYEAVAACLNKPVAHLLDLGCGTGLELERLLERYSGMQVTGVDLSHAMLERLRAKFPCRSLKLICGSYFDMDFGGPFDCVLSTYSLHHFSQEAKLELYRKIHAALQFEGFFVLGDYFVSTFEQQQELLAESSIKNQKQGIMEGELYHFDTPLTPEMEMRLLYMAGFTNVQIVRQWENSCIMTARKGDECAGSVYNSVL